MPCSCAAAKLGDSIAGVDAVPRYCRAFFSGIPLHIVQRGHDRQPVFVDRDDYEYYLANMVEAQATCDLSVHAYCLMTNHVHLLLSPGQIVESVSAFMRVLAARQTRYINKREERTGTLWEGRFKASPIDSAAYLLACYRYIELNPVRAGMVSSPGDYEWSSYHYNSGEEQADDWLEPHSEYQALGGDPSARAASYRELIRAGLPRKDCETIRVALQRNQVTGNDKFRERLEQRSGRRLPHRGPGRPRKRT